MGGTITTRFAGVSRRPALRGVLALAFLALALVYIAIGALWMVKNVGSIPPYGDTGEYLQLSRNLKVDEYRGVLYPALLAWGNRDARIPMTVRVLVIDAVLKLQLGVGVLSLGYFLYVMAGGALRRWTGSTPGALAGLLLLLAMLHLDPLVAHFNLSILTDGLALSGSLIFCAALAQLGRHRSLPVVPACLLFVAYLTTAGLRAEKNWVLIGSTFLTVAVWWWVAGRASPDLGRGLRRRALVALGLACVGFLVMLGLQRWAYEEQGRWPLSTTILHQRIIFPNLAPTYPHLPEEPRALISPQLASSYDMRIHNTWRVIDAVTHGDANQRDRLTSQLVWPVLEARWHWIASKILLDTAENVLAPFSFYGRLGRWIRDGQRPTAFRVTFEATPFTYFMLAQAQPRLSLIYLKFAGAFLLTTVLLTLLQLPAMRRSWRARDHDDAIVLAAPVASFCLVNALAFSTTANLVHIRYVLFAHVAVLLLFYLGALRWALVSRAPRVVR